ncbi:MAG TPA: hypothetical protein VK760_13400, partial [Candidatus Acidoferrales bacterium]|nr:hypothetical protein [Candidatus Acidoferrales bacterium]
MLVAFILAVSIDAAPAPAASASPSPQQIFWQTFARLESYPIAPYTIWADTWLRKQHDTRKSGDPVSTITQFRYAVRSSDGAETYTFYPVAGTSLPPGRVGKQFLGPFAFILRPNRTQQAEPAPLQPDIPEPLKVIANVVAYPKPAYAIESGPLETLAGHAVYHLRLRALADG